MITDKHSRTSLDYRPTCRTYSCFIKIVSLKILNSNSKNNNNSSLEVNIEQKYRREWKILCEGVSKRAYSIFQKEKKMFKGKIKRHCKELRESSKLISASIWNAQTELPLDFVSIKYSFDLNWILWKWFRCGFSEDEELSSIHDVHVGFFKLPY